ncbi:hypothetical protein FNT36_16200 [Hymenobacter setariae]|uniref:Uncharacterized protein n=1 Tax=Hymenobacter setariae TaxID=2594794 RepID=A0A558BRR8_9BACT|nr:hypothetical protein [Hymenobacter setariae]TVT39201.1 hypothetical protein FNT36_16200 [Hymenobacter setariae]
MNQYFNLARFGRLLRKHTLEHIKGYAISVAVLAGGIAVVLGSLTYLRHWPLDHEMQLILFIFGLLAAGGVFTSTVFAEVGDPKRAATALLLPTSHIEKYLVAWFYSLPLFLVIYAVVFTGVNLLILKVGSNGHPYELYDFSRGASEWVSPLLSYVLLHSVALWGAIYFQRLHVIKTAFLIFGSMLLLLLVNRQVMLALLPSSRPIAPFSDVWVGEGMQSSLLSLPDNQWQLLMVLLPIALAMLLWAASYARLTEKQL